VIQILNLVKRFADVTAVNRISFDVAAGDIFGFIGPNGAGKTTTIRIIATLLDLSAGDVRVDGHSVISEPEKVRRVIGYMPDLFGVYERLTVWEYLDFFAHSYGLAPAERRRTVDGVMELTDLTAVRDRPAGGLSKGMRQRLCLAKTLVHDPKVLVLDEPASGLDPRARIEFRELLRTLREMGKTILLSSHILTELSDVCNAVAILERGALVASGNIEEIRRRVGRTSSWKLEVLGGADPAARLLEPMAGVGRVACVDGQVTFELEGEREQVAEIVRRLVAADVRLVGCQEVKTDLEGLFMRLTRGEVM
jgi:ABC-2 type transport system ATP-binding protein